jgi:hypothetical protein
MRNCKRKSSELMHFAVLDEEAAEGIKHETIRMAQEHGDWIDWLIDLSQMTKATSKARKIPAEASGHPSINKYAFAGASVFIRAAGKGEHMKWFAAEEEAVEWLKEGIEND